MLGQDSRKRCWLAGARPARCKGLGFKSIHKLQM